jgi:hypothetical protein
MSGGEPCLGDGARVYTRSRLELRSLARRPTRAESELFRIGNERLSAAVDDRYPHAVTLPFLCECADELWHGKMKLDRAQSKRGRVPPNQFVMVPRHQCRKEGPTSAPSRGRRLEGYEVVRTPT